MSSIEHHCIKKSVSVMNATNNVPVDSNQKSVSSKPTDDHHNPNRKRRNTIHILINATMQFLSSPPTSPTFVDSPTKDLCSTPLSINFNESSYFSFPEFETFNYDHIQEDRGSRGEADNLIVQMEQFDEMYVNGIRVRQT